LSNVVAGVQRTAFDRVNRDEPGGRRVVRPRSHLDQTAVDRYGHLFDQSYAEASDAIEQAFELPSAEEAFAAASGPPALSVQAVPSPAASAQAAAVVPLEQQAP
jgi:hypothetical protein